MAGHSIGTNTTDDRYIRTEKDVDAIALTLGIEPTAAKDLLKRMSVEVERMPPEVIADLQRRTLEAVENDSLRKSAHDQLHIIVELVRCSFFISRSRSRIVHLYDTRSAMVIRCLECTGIGFHTV